MKVCINCNLNQPLANFTYKHNKPIPRCRPCQNVKARAGYLKRNSSNKVIAKNKINRSKNIERLNVYKNACGCLLCGYNACAKALDFHHIKKKSFPIGEAVIRGTGLKSLTKEIKKCILLCANCHREVHFGVRSLMEVKQRATEFKAPYHLLESK